jgi:GTP-binding protein
MEIRNIAIIAHVDHGKTTLTDALMRQTKMVDDSISMDSNALEKERGITIYSKNTSVLYRDTKINIVDTPGHADFSSEVERILRSIDCVLLLVDAQEGPMPQTKFVLKKSLELGLKPIVVINKIDKPAADPKKCEEDVFELFFNLGATEEQLNFPIIYAIGRLGIAKRKLEDESSDLTPLLEMIMEKVPPASDPEKTDKPLLAQVFNLGYDNFLGRFAITRIYEGKIKPGQDVVVKEGNGKNYKGRTTKIFTFYGPKREEIAEAGSGDIVMIAGLPEIFIGDTICQSEDQPSMPAISIDEPTISLNFLINNSPFGGRDGKYVTNRQLKDRLEKELEVNVGLKIDFSNGDFYKVYGRGELHIEILLENMRREGYEVQVSQPQVIIKEENGVKVEPFEEVIIDVPEKMSGSVIEKLSRRKGLMQEIKNHNGQTRLVFEVPTRGILGYRGEFVVDTRGEGIMCSRVIGFKPHVGEIEKHDVGSMVSGVTGKATGFDLWNLQNRGVIYIQPGTEIYEGMIIGDVSKGGELIVNPIKGKRLSNVRASGSDEAIVLVPPWEISIERGLSVMKEDEYLEITPNNIRLRKRELTENERVRAKRKVSK